MSRKLDESFIKAINATKRKSGRRLTREALASVGKRGIYGMAAKRRRTHKDVEFQVSPARSTDIIGTYKTFDEAAGVAVARSASTGEKVEINVLIYSKAGARWYGGDHALEEYDADPDASVHDRIVVKAESTGRVY